MKYLSFLPRIIYIIYLYIDSINNIFITHIYQNKDIDYLYYSYLSK